MALDMVCMWDWTTRQRLLYAASMVAYGFYGDVVHSSEALRWLYVAGLVLLPQSWAWNRLHSRCYFYSYVRSRGVTLSLGIAGRCLTKEECFLTSPENLGPKGSLSLQRPGALHCLWG